MAYQWEVMDDVVVVIEMAVGSRMEVAVVEVVVVAIMAVAFVEVLAAIVEFDELQVIADEMPMND